MASTDLFVLTCFVLLWRPMEAQHHGGRKIQFSPIESIIGMPVTFSNKASPPESSHEFLEGLQLVMVTKDGYEYTGSLEEVENLFYTKEVKDIDEFPTELPTRNPPTELPTHNPWKLPTELPTHNPWKLPTELPTHNPGEFPTELPTRGFREVLEDTLEDLAEKRSIIGRDERHHQVPYHFPFTAIGRIAVGCTGTFISHNTVLTVAHCIHGHSGWYYNLNIHRAKDCDPNKGQVHNWESAIILRSWINNPHPENDIGWIIVSTPSPVSMSFTYLTPPTRTTTIFIYGYPADFRRLCLYGTSCPLAKVLDKRLRYTCDTYGGNSGSPIYYNKTGVYTIIGVHAYGVKQRKNSGTRMTSVYFLITQKIIKRFADFIF